MNTQTHFPLPDNSLYETALRNGIVYTGNKGDIAQESAFIQPANLRRIIAYLQSPPETAAFERHAIETDPRLLLYVMIQPDRTYLIYNTCVRAAETQEFNPEADLLRAAFPTTAFFGSSLRTFNSKNGE